MERAISRRQFNTNLVLGLGAAATLDAQTRPRRLAVGHTGITWGFKPDDAQAAIRDVAALGFSGFESFGNILEAWEPRGGLTTLLEPAKLPLRSAYCDVNLTDPTKRAAEIEKVVRWGRLIRKCGGSVAVVGPNGVKRAEFVFAD